MLSYHKRSDACGQNRLHRPGITGLPRDWLPHRMTGALAKKVYGYFELDNDRPNSV
jgi:hypothetical protein